MSEGTSLVMESSENGTDVSQDDAGTMEETAEDTILSRQTSVNLTPFIGQRFVSQDAAYEFYCSFAKQCGFSIRRHRTRGKDGVGRGVTRRDFTCHRGGYPQMKPSEDGKMQRKRKSARCGCQSYMRIVKRADFDVPEWRVTSFSNVHNHELLKSNQVNLLPAYCSLSPEDKIRICMFAKAGMSVRQMLRLMELEKGVKLGCFPFTEIDVRNLLQSFRNINREIDAIDLIAMCKNLKDEDHNFKYDFKIDMNNRLERIAWSYTSSVELYEAFGDAVIFDTTHRFEAYDMLLGIWIGVDNHGVPCFFSCVLLRDENVHSFAWALKAFMKFMKGKAPQTILTDQNMWLKEAISVEMPETKHAFCIWHIMAMFSDWFSLQLGSCYDAWKSEFLQLYNMEFVEDFEEGWHEMIDKYGLHANKHIASLYSFRTFWASSYLRPYFFAGMTNACQSVSINVFIEQFLSAQTQIDRFVNRAADIVATTDHTRANPEMHQRLHKVHLKTGSPIESHAASVLSPYAFSKFQEEFILAPQYASFPIDEYCYEVRYHNHMNGGCKIIWDPCQGHINCSCNLFEFSGFLCRHVLRVLSTTNCFQIPDHYLPTRWHDITPSSSNGIHFEKIRLLQSMASTLVTESIETDERLDVACEQIGMVLSHVRTIPSQTQSENAYNCPSESLILSDVEGADGVVQSFTSGNSHGSITLGKLKERKLREVIDVSRKRRNYSESCCGRFGHYASDCPLIGSDHLDSTALGYL